MDTDKVDHHFTNQFKLFALIGGSIIISAFIIGSSIYLASNSLDTRSRATETNLNGVINGDEPPPPPRRGGDEWITPVPGCNAECNNQTGPYCPSGLTCYDEDGDDDGVCRLPNDPTNYYCQPIPRYDPTNPPPPPPNYVWPTLTPVPGCNRECNNDTGPYCLQGLVCYDEDGDGDGVCRLPSNLTSTQCDETLPAKMPIEP